MINKLIGAAIAVVIGLALLPVVLEVIEDLVTGYTGEMGTGTETLVGILPLIYVVILIAGAVAFIKYK